MIVVKNKIGHIYRGVVLKSLSIFYHFQKIRNILFGLKEAVKQVLHFTGAREK